MAILQNHSFSILSKGEYSITFDDYYRFQSAHSLTIEQIVNLCGEYQQMFRKKWLKERGLYGVSLFDLANDKTNGGCDLWLKEGFDWHGYFDLRLDSDNRKLLRTYLAERELSANI